MAAGRPVPILIMHLLDLSEHCSFLHQMFPQHSNSIWKDYISKKSKTVIPLYTEHLITLAITQFYLPLMNLSISSIKLLNKSANI